MSSRSKSWPRTRARIGRGVAQVSAPWREEDGDLAAFVDEYFIPDDTRMDPGVRQVLKGPSEPVRRRA